MSFYITGGKGFQISFEGWTVSVQFGPGNYCEHHFKPLLSPPVQEKEDLIGSWKSKEAEIAVIKDGHGLIKLGSGTVLGYVTSKQVSELIQQVSTFDKDMAPEIAEFHLSWLWDKK